MRRGPGARQMVVEAADRRELPGDARPRKPALREHGRVAPQVAIGEGSEAPFPGAWPTRRARRGRRRRPAGCGARSPGARARAGSRGEPPPMRGLRPAQQSRRSCRGASPPRPPRLPVQAGLRASVPDVDRSAQRDLGIQLDHVRDRHPDAAMRGRSAER